MSIEEIKLLADRELQELEHDTLVDLNDMLINDTGYTELYQYYDALIRERQSRNLEFLPYLNGFN